MTSDVDLPAVIARRSLPLRVEPAFRVDRARVERLEERDPLPVDGSSTGVFVFQRGHRLLVTSFSTRSTLAQGRRVAADVAPRI